MPSRTPLADKLRTLITQVECEEISILYFEQEVNKIAQEVEDLEYQILEMGELDA